MPKQDFIPNRDGDFVDYHDNFKAAATSDGVTVGLTPADQTAIGNDNTAVHTSIYLHIYENNNILQTHIPFYSNNAYCTGDILH